jgi:hypothetical protein
MRMSIKQRGRNLETKVVRGSKTIGRDVEKAGKRVGQATKRGVTRVEARLKSKRRG